MSPFAPLRKWFLSLARRRSYRRVASTLAVRWRAFGSRVNHVSQLADLSMGGACLQTSTPRPVGSPVVLDLATARGELTVHANVAWTARGGMGLRFTRPISPSL